VAHRELSEAGLWGGGLVGLRNAERNAMSETPAWKKTLREPNAVGWIAFFFLVVVIGFGSVYFGGVQPPKVGVHHAAK
jgi:hypothetical protein